MLNQISVQGRIVRDPELRRTASGKAVTSFTLACDRDFKNQQTGEKEVDFIECVAWGGTAEMVEKYFHKGQMAVATGRLQLRDWTDKNGQKRRQAEILVNNIYFCGSKESGTQASSGADNGYSTPAYQAPAPAANFAELDGEDEQLPF
jgi:single-strand DNA-binding protein|nr:MAG TPA: Single strand binding protein [Caudoviricetes sp.]DAP42405.1 MAG TPA: Single strand binding protein [Caudoviricetes sp.]DAZ07033.1 MAG TPA: Single strand binding protein [Caudoviricetes sp.]